MQLSDAGVAHPFRAIVLILAAATLCGDRASAQDERETGWFFTSELAAVLTSGNSQSRTVGLGGTLRRVWERSSLTFEGAGTRTESTLISRTAVGTSQQDFVLQETKNTETTAELYSVRARYDYNLSERFYTFGGTDWLRNTFAGIESRFLLAAGAGNSWVDNERVRFKTDYGITYTFEEEVVNNPFAESNFPGLRLGYDLGWSITGSTDFNSILLGDWNLDNTDDIRIDLKNELPISISELFSLKPTLRFMWRNDPALAEVALFDSAGADTGRTVFVPLQNLDTLFTLALVFKI